MMELTLTALALVLATGAFAFVAWRQRRQRTAAFAAIAQRFAGRFPAVGEAPADAVPLQSPPGPSGRVAISPDGLLVSLDDQPGARRVPWSAIHHVDTSAGGAIRVHISDVGDLAVPLAVGRQIWDATLAVAAGPHAGRRLPA